MSLLQAAWRRTVTSKNGLVQHGRAAASSNVLTFGLTGQSAQNSVLTAGELKLERLSM